MKRILCIHPALAPYRIDLFNALSEKVDLQIILLRKNLRSQQFNQEILRSKLLAPCRDHQRNLEFNRRMFPLDLPKTIREFEPDVVVTHEFSPATIRLLLDRKLFRAPFRHVVWSADYPDAILRDSIGRRIIRRRVLPCVDGLILYTDRMANIYREKYGFRGAIGISPNIQKEESVNALLSASENELPKICAQYDLIGKKLLLYVGRFAPEKNLIRLIESFAKLFSNNSNIRLCLIGGGTEEDALKALAKKITGDENAVLFPGRLEDKDLYAWYRLASLFVLPSLHEPYGAVVNEALLSGIPVVCSDRAGASTLIQNGTNGSLFDPSSVELLTSELKKWIPKIQPVSGDKNMAKRPSLMPMAFSDAVDGWLKPCMQN